MRSAIATIKVLNYYAKKLQRLRGDRTHGVAPHKLILLLSVIELIAKEEINENKIYLSPQLMRSCTLVRSAAFRRIVVSLYEQRYVFRHLKIISSDNQNIVDGAHIKPFSKFRDGRLTNGLALCKNNHWAFDHSWFGVDDDYRIVISWECFKEGAAVERRGMMQSKGERIELPREERFMPSLEGLR